jgi:hypothetical protein
LRHAGGDVKNLSLFRRWRPGLTRARVIAAGLAGSCPAAENLWELVRRTRDSHEFNTLFPARGWAHQWR